MKASEVDAWFRHQGHQPGDEIQWFENHMSGAIIVRCFELVADLTIAGQCQAFGGYRRPGDVAAQAFQFMPFIGPGGNAGVQRESRLLLPA